jgi:DNA-binding NtrC family response regulator
MKRSVCILLVEDDRILGPLTHDALDMLGHRSVLAASALSLHTVLSRQHSFEVMLLDLQLGDERSEPVIEKLREKGWHIPHIIVMSAQPLLDIERSIRIVGAKGFLQKPVSLDDIDQAIDAAVA